MNLDQRRSLHLHRNHKSRLKRLITIVHLVFTVVEVPADPCRVVSGSHRVLQTLDHSADVLQGLENCCTLVQKMQVHNLEVDYRTFFISSYPNNQPGYGNVVKVTSLTCGLSAGSESTRTWNGEPRASSLCQGRQEVLLLLLFLQVYTDAHELI